MIVLGAAEAVTSGSLLLAVPVALAAGLLSFASPCVLPLVPGYLGFLGGMTGAAAPAGSPGRSESPGPSGSPGSRDPSGFPHSSALPGPPRSPALPDSPGSPDASGLVASSPADPGRPLVSRGRLTACVAAFVAGFTVVFVGLGTLAGGLGALVLREQDLIVRVLGVGVIALGLAFSGLVPWPARQWRPAAARSGDLLGAGLLGLAFAVGWTPCIGPTLGAVVALSLDQASAGRGALLAVAYCLGLGLPFLAVALAFRAGTRVLGPLRRHRVAIRIAGSVLLVAVGLAMVTGLWGQVTSALQGLVAGFGPVL